LLSARAELELVRNNFIPWKVLLSPQILISAKVSDGSKLDEVSRLTSETREPFYYPNIGVAEKHDDVDELKLFYGKDEFTGVCLVMSFYA